MASIIDSFRETFGDNLSFLKIFVFAIPVFYTYHLYATANGNYSGFYFWLDITVVLLLGLLLKVTNGVLNEKDSVFPSLNPFKIALAGIKTVIAILPVTLLCVYLSNYICSMINIIDWLDITLKIIIWLVASSIIITTFLMFATKERILDAFRLKMLYEKAGDAILMILFYVLQLVIINIPTTAFIGYIVIVLFGIGGSLGWVLELYVSMVLVFNIAITGHYFAQMHYELIGRIRD